MAVVRRFYIVCAIFGCTLLLMKAFPFVGVLLMLPLPFGAFMLIMGSLSYLITGRWP